MLAAALALLAASVAQPAAADGETFDVARTRIADEKAVFATVESLDVVPARARLSGTIGELRIDEGDRVESGEVIAVVVSEQISPQIASLNSRVAALEAQLEQARADLARDQRLFDRGIVSEARIETARTQVQVLENQVASAREERAVVVQRAREGDVLAPASGVVLEAPLTSGSVVQPGEVVARVASEQYVLRLRLPERHARFIAEGDEIRVDAAALAGDVGDRGVIRQVYPEIRDGRVIADARVEGLGDYFVGERVRVFVATDERDAILVPEPFLSTRYGLDYALLSQDDGTVREVVVQRGPARRETDDGTPLIEILSGLEPGDRLVAP
ncbi:efflux RND transporter periplasmic adaptor subunit [Marinicauda salina]|uniref:Efflux RND transporter periplasmic adaptor subunit n=1 Tax=Marinicauda salina TaxID=2135793 RepID=A0A2U2BWX2_9PROT|nr:efflux RND transporter periplasmic adaptor subunit [Marinicauda salina]PWE18497.1 efflux RND transporter periplasmic adaptor subunit [Marinicauda salina]